MGDAPQQIWEAWTQMTPEQLLEDAKAAYLLKQRTVFANPHDGGMRAALRVAIEAAANVAEERSENPHWAPECRKAALSIASRIRALLPTEETP